MSADADDAMFVFLLAETSVHAGTGAVLSHVDLPIQREAHTNHPIIYASGVKGALRDHCEGWIDAQSQEKDLDRKRLEALFGPEKAADEHGGHGIFQEARVLLFPVRSFKGVFAWVTCPYVLERFRRDLAALGFQAQGLPAAAPRLSEGQAIVAGGSDLWVVKNERIVLEDYDFAPTQKNGEKPDPQEQDLGEWLKSRALPEQAAADPFQWWREKLGKDVVILSDDDYAYMVETHTEIQTHVKIDKKTGTAAKSGPWNEEALPPETLLYTSVASPRVLSQKVKDKLKGNQPLGLLNEALKGVPLVRMAGDRSLGKGQLRATVYPPRESPTQGGGNAESGTTTR